MVLLELIKEGSGEVLVEMEEQLDGLKMKRVGSVSARNMFFIDACEAVRDRLPGQKLPLIENTGDDRARDSLRQGRDNVACPQLRTRA